MIIKHYRHINDPDGWDDGLLCLCRKYTEAEFLNACNAGVKIQAIEFGYENSSKDVPTCEACALIAALNPELIHRKHV